MSEDILTDSWLFKELIEKGKQQGLDRGRQEGLRETIIALVERLHPALLPAGENKG